MNAFAYLDPELTGVIAPSPRGQAPRSFAMLPGGLRLAYAESGDPCGPPTVLLHGFSDSSHSFSLMRPHLAGKRLISVDLRGHGASGKPESDYSAASLAGDVRGLLDALGVRSATVVGHDLGGLVGQHLAACSPDRVRSLVLIGSTAGPLIRLGDWLWTEIEALSAEPRRGSVFLTELLASPSPVPVSFLSAMRDESLRLPLHVWRGVARAHTDVDTLSVARAIRAPTLILWGERDPAVGAEQQLVLRSAISGSRLCRLPGLGHHPHWELPDSVAALVTEFIEQHARRPD